MCFSKLSYSTQTVVYAPNDTKALVRGEEEGGRRSRYCGCSVSSSSTHFGRTVTQEGVHGKGLFTPENVASFEKNRLARFECEGLDWNGQTILWRVAEDKDPLPVVFQSIRLLVKVIGENLNKICRASGVKALVYKVSYETTKGKDMKGGANTPVASAEIEGHSSKERCDSRVLKCVFE